MRERCCTWIYPMEKMYWSGRSRIKERRKGKERKGKDGMLSHNASKSFRDMALHTPLFVPKEQRPWHSTSMVLPSQKNCHVPAQCTKISCTSPFGRKESRHSFHCVRISLISEMNSRKISCARCLFELLFDGYCFVSPPTAHWLPFSPMHVS